MLWLSNKIGNLVEKINPKDIAFMLASNLEMNKQKGSRHKAQIALDSLASHFSFKNFIFEFYLKEDPKLRCVALSGVYSDLKNLYLGRSVTRDSLVHKAFESGNIEFFTNLKKEIGRRAEFIKKAEIKSSLFIPAGDFGVLVVNREDTKKFEKYQLGLLKSFVDDVVVPSLGLSLNNEKNFRASITDPLTGLYNHGYFKFQLEREFENAKRAKNNLSLIMGDIDYFKYYNDMNGHPKGDKVLANIAGILKHNSRTGDIVARYGGEEFAILLFGANVNDTAEKAESLRRAVALFHFENEELQPNKDVTISLGIANFPKHAKSYQELLDKADKALYHSKHAGKNRVSIYGKFK